MGGCRAALAVTTAVVMGAGPTADAASAATYVGKVKGSDAFIAVAKDGRKIGGYLCDNGTVSRWIEYAWLRHGRAPLIAGTTGKRLGTVKVAGTAASGTIEVGGAKRSFRAKRVKSQRTGLFFAVGKQKGRILVGGWILRPGGSQRGAVSSVDTQSLSSLAPSKAPRLKPSAERIRITGDPMQPPVVTEPQQLVVINIIAILISLLRARPCRPDPRNSARGLRDEPAHVGGRLASRRRRAPSSTAAMYCSAQSGNG